MRRFSSVLIFVVICQCSMFNPQCSMLNAAPTKPVKYKTLLSEAKAAIKSGKNQANAEQNLLAIINREDITKERRAEIYYMSEELERSLNEAENLKFYLGKSYDTVRFFSTILHMHEHLMACDSVEQIPDEKGVVKYKYRSKGREILKQYRANLLNGGKYMLKRSRYAEAYPYFDMYLKSAESAFFEDYPSIRHDTLLYRTSLWATLSAYNNNSPSEALKYIDKAISGSELSARVSLQEYKVRCLAALGDEDARVENLIVGTQLYPQHNYFFLHLMDVYTERKQYDDGIALCDTMISQVGDSAIYWYGKSRMYIAKQEYDSCIVASEKALELDPMMDGAYYDKGMSYLNKALIFSETVCNDIRNPKCKADRAKLMELYRCAQKPMEKVRELCPYDSGRWASPLYRIYLNLNMGKEFAEMEKILNSQ